MVPFFDCLRDSLPMRECAHRYRNHHDFSTPRASSPHGWEPILQPHVLRVSYFSFAFLLVYAITRCHDTKDTSCILIKLWPQRTEHQEVSLTRYIVALIKGALRHPNSAPNHRKCRYEPLEPYTSRTSLPCSSRTSNRTCHAQQPFLGSSEAGACNLKHVPRI
jgi:hypothetical protein